MLAHVSTCMTVALLALAVLCSAAPAQPAESPASGPAATVYVSPAGDDAAPGTAARPVATLGRAQAAARDLRKGGQAHVTVQVAPGTYFLPAPLVLTPDDSNTTFRGDLDHPPLISGGVPLSLTWKPYKDHVLVADLPAGAPADFTALFVNNRRQVRARYPNVDPMTSLANFTQIDLANFPRAAEKGWTHADRAVFHCIAKRPWNSLHYRIASIDGKAVHLGEGGWQARYNGDPGPSAYIENVLEELDAPGEWYLDPDARRLYLYPEAGVDPAKAPVIAAVLKQLVEFRGEPGRPVHHVALEALAFSHTAPTFLDDFYAPSGGDVAIHPGGTIFLEGSEDCAVRQCALDALGGNALYAANYNRRLVVDSNRFALAGDSAVALVGAAEAWFDPTKGDMTRFRRLEPKSPGGLHVLNPKWDKATAYPADCTVTNNLIHDCGVYVKESAGVFVAVADSITVSHNLIYNLPRSGICINDGTWGGHVVEHNDVRYTVRETGDHGPFNSWQRDKLPARNGGESPVLRPQDRKPVTIRHNRFVDQNRGGWGIDLDDGSSDFVIEDNLCVGVALKLRDGDRRTVRNNIFVSRRPPNFHVGFEKNVDTFTGNVVVSRDADVLYHFIQPPPGRFLKEMDHNLFFNDKNTFAVTGAVARNSPKLEIPPPDFGKVPSLEAWQKLGYDAHSVFADPLFVDPHKGDFSLKPDSPALKLGFRQIDMASFGLLPSFPKQLRDSAPATPSTQPGRGTDDGGAIGI